MAQNDLDGVLAEYLEAEDAGRPPDRRRFIERYPEFAAELELFFANQDQFSALAEPLGPVPLASRPAGLPPAADVSSDRTTDTADRSQAGSIRIFGPYELIDEVARGGMGIVYKARHIGLNRIVALKMILAGQFASSDELERFRVEAQAAAQLNHPNIVPIYEVGEEDGQHYFTMRYIEGCSLADDLPRWKCNTRAAARLLVVLARAVHYAHQHGILHRDLKPANVLLEECDESQSIGRTATGMPEGQPVTLPSRPFITDFGLAKVMNDDSDLTHTGAILGSPSYMAPEQAAGKHREITTAADVYSLGAILYALITGRPPFRADSPSETVRQVIEREPDRPSRIGSRVESDLETICLKCLEKEPSRRYESAAGLADDLDRWLENRPIQARRAGVLERAVKWARRKPAAASLMAVSVAATFALIAGTLWSNARLQAEITKVGIEHAKAQANFDRSEEHRLRAEERERTGRRHLYAATMNLAEQAWESGHVGRVLAMLEKQRPIAGEEDLRGFEWYHLWHQCHRAHIATIRSGGGRVRCVTHTPDGQSLIFGSADGRIQFFDLASGTIRSTLNAHTAAVRCLAVAPDGESFVSAGSDGFARIWQLDQLQLLHSIPTIAAETANAIVAIAPGSEQIILPDMGSHLRVYESQSGREQERFAGHASSVNAVAFSADGRTLASAGSDYMVRLYDLETKDSVVLGAHRYYAISLAFSRDGAVLASGGEEGVVKLWDVATRTLLQSWEAHAGNVYSLAFSPDGLSLASAGEDGAAKIRNLSTATETEFGHVGPVYSVNFSPDGKRLATASADGSVKLWTVHGEQARETFQAHKRKHLVYAVEFSPDGKTLASGSADRTVKLWDVATGSELRSFEGHTGKVVALAFTPDGKTLVSGGSIDAPVGEANGERGTIKVWDILGGSLLDTIAAHSEAAWGVAISPDGATIASAGYTDNVVAFWDLGSRRPRAKLTGHTTRLFCVAFAPDGTKVASGCVSHSPDQVGAIIWNAKTGEKLHELRVPWVWSIAFSPDSRTVATASEGGIAKLWDADTGKEKLTCHGHTTSVRSVRFMPDGQTFATASDDKTVKLWDVVTGQERATFRGVDHFWSLAVSPDGRTLAAGRGDGAITRWQAATATDVLRQSARPAQ